MGEKELTKIPYILESFFTIKNEKTLNRIIKIDKEKFRGAVEKTFKKREFDADPITNLNIVKESKVLKDKWISYSRKYSYARDIEFEETLKCLEQFINIIVPVLV